MQKSHVLLGSTIGFGVLYLAGGLALGTTPDANDNGATVAAWFRDNHGHVRAWLWLITLGLPLFATFAVLVRDRLPTPHRDIFFVGAIALAAQTAVYGWFWGGLSWHADRLDAATARTVLDVASFWGPVLTASTVMMLAPVVGLAFARHPLVPRRLGVISAVALAEQVVETVTIFGDRGFTAPGGPMNLFLGAGLVSLAWLSLGVSLARSRPIVPADE